MTRALELTTDAGVRADLYAELAFESTFRGAMWRREPGQDLVGGWIELGLALASPGTRPLARALLAKAMWEDDAELADQALAIAEGLDDVELVSYALFARAAIAFITGDYAAAVEWTERRLLLLDRFTDPDHRALIEMFAVLPYVGADVWRRRGSTPDTSSRSRSR